MSNPTNGVWMFNGDAGDWVITGPERYDNGLWIEEGTTNLVTNPSLESNDTHWGSSTATVARDTGVGEYGSASYRMTATSTTPDCFHTQVGGGVASGSHTVSISLLHDGAAARNAHLRHAGADGSATSIPPGAWTRYSRTVTPNAGNVQIIPKITNAVIAEQFWWDGAQVEAKSYATSYCDGTLGTGYAWTGTAHNSTSTRAASSASISPSGILAPGSGALAFRFRRLIDTGGIETLLECGTDGASTDYLALTIDASDKLVMAWTANGGSAQTVTSTESIAVDTEYLLYVEWDGTQMALSIDNGALVTGTRDTPQGSWGVGDLVLKAE